MPNPPSSAPTRARMTDASATLITPAGHAAWKVDATSWSCLQDRIPGLRGVSAGGGGGGGADGSSAMMLISSTNSCPLSFRSCGSSVSASAAFLTTAMTALTALHSAWYLSAIQDSRRSLVTWAASFNSRMYTSALVASLSNRRVRISLSRRYASCPAISTIFSCFFAAISSSDSASGSGVFAFPLGSAPSSPSSPGGAGIMARAATSAAWRVGTDSASGTSQLGDADSSSPGVSFPPFLAPVSGVCAAVAPVYPPISTREVFFASSCSSFLGCKRWPHLAR
mmetsp:Transcript_2896/g.3269  ORF Transcript_2896/g.3269 Transcript_2896/m.3269 type:complete len:282 (+) Transcript_2896:870-1715(+)